MNKIKHYIMNDFKLDAIRANIEPPKMGDIGDDEVVELFERIGLNYDFFIDYVKKESEYYTDKGHKFYLIKDVAMVIRHLTNIEDIMNTDNWREEFDKKFTICSDRLELKDFISTLIEQVQDEYKIKGERNRLIEQVREETKKEINHLQTKETNCSACGKKMNISQRIVWEEDICDGCNISLTIT